MPASLLSYVLLDGPGMAAFLCAPLEAGSDLFDANKERHQTDGLRVRGWRSPLLAGQ